MADQDYIDYDEYESEGPKSKRGLIIGIVAAVLICCCCVFAIAGWFYGDQILEQFSSLLGLI